MYPKPAPNLDTWTSNFYYILKEKKTTQTESQSLQKNKFEQCHGSNLRIHAIQLFKHLTINPSPDPAMAEASCTGLAPFRMF